MYFQRNSIRMYYTGDTQRNSTNVNQIFFLLCDDHPVQDSAAQFIYKTDNANNSANHTYVANIYDLKLSHVHLFLQNRGLSFCPTPSYINPV